MNRTTDYEKLFDLKEDASLDESLRGQLTLLYQAMTDWPGSSGRINDFLADIKCFLNTELLTFNAIDKSLAGIDSGRFAWQKEALCSLRELASSGKGKTIDEIVMQILR